MNLPEFTYWGWLIAGVLFAVLEMVLPFMFFLWVGAAAMVVGILKTLAPGMSPELQLLIFATLSLLALVGSRLYMRRHPLESDAPALNQKGHQYIGRVFALEQPIVNGQGRIRVDDAFWKVRGSDQALPGKVRVTAVDGMMLVVEAVQD